MKTYSEAIAMLKREIKSLCADAQKYDLPKEYQQAVEDFLEVEITPSFALGIK